MPRFEKPTISFHPNGKENRNALFSILIPSWNNLELLKLCVQSIKDNSTHVHQIIIHINEGMDGTLEWVKSENLDYSYSEQNAGVCHSINAMAGLAGTSYLLYLNDDMYVCKGWDDALWKVASGFKHKYWYLSGTMIEPVKSSSSCVASPHNFGRNPSDFLRNDLDLFASGLKRKDWFGASWPPSLVHKEVFMEVGGYSEEFSPGMYSDPDFSMKLWKAGVREFRGIGKSLVYHFMSRSTGRVRKNNGRKQFAIKWGVPSSFFYRKLLKMGQPFNAKKSLSAPPLLFWLPARLKAWWIRFK